MSQNLLLSPVDLNEPVDPRDPFAYGWRYVKKSGRDGSESMVQVPLTLEDILHPQEEDFHVVSDAHTRDLIYLRGAFEIALAGVRGAFVLSDCRVAWDAAGNDALGPDCAVVFNVRERKVWSTFNVVEEQAKPALIIEVTSPHTRSTDLVDKVREYAKQGVSHYVIADARETQEGRKISLTDYRLSQSQLEYLSLPLSDTGRIWLPEVNLWLAVETGRLICQDAAGNRIHTIVEENQARREAEKARNEAEKARRDAEAKAALLEEQIRKLEEQLKKASDTKDSRNGASG